MASFALLALVPLTTFRLVAFTMAIGLLIDAFIVRQLLVPAFVVLAGRRSGWPRRRLGQRPEGRKGKRRTDEGGR